MAERINLFFFLNYLDILMLICISKSNVPFSHINRRRQAGSPESESNSISNEAESDSTSNEN